MIGICQKRGELFISVGIVVKVFFVVESAIRQFFFLAAHITDLRGVILMVEHAEISFLFFLRKF